MTLTPGDYFVVATDGYGAKFIRFFERHAANPKDREGAWANHAGIYLGRGDVATTPDIAEASGPHFRLARLTDYDGLKIAFSSRPLTDAQRNQAVGIAHEMADAKIPYGFLDILALGASALGAVPQPVWDRLNDGRTMICSQSVARIYRLIGDPITAGPDCRVTPAHLARTDVLTGGSP